MSENNIKKKNMKTIAASILSLSLLTVMAGAAVAPALGVIENHFAGENKLLIQMIISTPAIFIVLTNLIFPALCKHMKIKTMVMTGLILYTVGGCAAGTFDNIWAVLSMRALVGVGVGIIMPLSTGLLTFYFPKDAHEKMMGYSSAMNQMGGVAATVISGILAQISWRASFLVYLMGLISIVLCLICLPNDKLITAGRPGKNTGRDKNSTAKEFLPYIVAMFLLMITFFIYPSNFAIETSADGVIAPKFITFIMAGMDLTAFAGGLMFVTIKAKLRSRTALFAPSLFLAGYILLTFVGGWAGTLIGSVFIGFANGAGIPFIISEGSKKAGRAAAATVLPLISAALYLAQFLVPILISAVSSISVLSGVTHLPYMTAIVTSALFLTWSAFSFRARASEKKQLKKEDHRAA